MGGREKSDLQGHHWQPATSPACPGRKQLRVSPDAGFGHRQSPGGKAAGTCRVPALQSSAAAPWPRSAYWADWDSKSSPHTRLAPGVCSKAQRSRGLKSEPRLTPYLAPVPGSVLQLLLRDFFGTPLPHQRPAHTFPSAEQPSMVSNCSW